MAAMRTSEWRALREEMQGHRDELKQLAGEIRVKIHLASMELKDTWEDLKPRIEDYAHRVEHITQDAAVELHGAGTDLKGRLRHLRDRLITPHPVKSTRRASVASSKAGRVRSSGRARARP